MSKHEFNAACQILLRYCPKTWQVISGRRYLVPDYRQNDYGNQLKLINEFADNLTAIICGSYQDDQRFFEQLVNLSLTLAHNRPTYFLERELGEALCRTELPDNIEADLIKWKFPQMRIMQFKS
jgi:hypothetical protein